MPAYSATVQRATASSTLSVGVVTASASVPRRSKLFRLEMGSEAAPADNAFLWQIQRCTTAGTAGSGVTYPAIDPGDIAGSAVVGQAHTTDPTLTANTILLSVPLNQRATYQWQPAPGRELVWPATASNGLALRTPTASAVAVTATIFWEE